MGGQGGEGRGCLSGTCASSAGEGGNVKVAHRGFTTPRVSTCNLRGQTARLPHRPPQPDRHPLRQWLASVPPLYHRWRRVDCRSPGERTVCPPVWGQLGPRQIQSGHPPPHSATRRRRAGNGIHEDREKSAGRRTDPPQPDRHPLRQRSASAPPLYHRWRRVDLRVLKVDMF